MWVEVECLEGRSGRKDLAPSVWRVGVRFNVKQVRFRRGSFPVTTAEKVDNSSSLRS